VRNRILVLIVLLGAGVRTSLAKPAPATIDCSVDGRVLTCNREQFLKRFAEAKTLTLQSQPSDRVADGELTSFSKSLGKRVVTAKPSDLTFRVVRTADTGFEVGPGDQELGSLRVFETKDGASRLIWMERYRGQADMPWPAVVRSLTRELQATLAGVSAGTN
jgi:hypothetical protein